MYNSFFLPLSWNSSWTSGAYNPTCRLTGEILTHVSTWDKKEDAWLGLPVFLPFHDQAPRWQCHAEPVEEDIVGDGGTSRWVEPRFWKGSWNRTAPAIMIEKESPYFSNCICVALLQRTLLLCSHLKMGKWNLQEVLSRANILGLPHQTLFLSNTFFILTHFYLFFFSLFINSLPFLGTSGSNTLHLWFSFLLVDS